MKLIQRLRKLSDEDLGELQEKILAEIERRHVASGTLPMRAADWTLRRPGAADSPLPTSAAQPVPSRRAA